MPTPTETLQAIRDAANVNAAALASVQDQVQDQQAAVRLWANSPSRGAMLDQLGRVEAQYRQAEQAALDTASMATRLITMFGQDPGNGPGPAPTTWSTGSW